MMKTLHRAMASALLASACTTERFEHGSDDADPQMLDPNRICTDWERKLSADGCGYCECIDNTWQCEAGRLTDAGVCDPVCSTGGVVPPYDECGVCTCIEGIWICDAGCECDDPPSLYCEPGGCNTYGYYTQEAWCYTDEATGGSLPGPPGEDPFATDAVVYCDEVVESLRDYRSEISPYPVVEFVRMATEGTDLVIDIEYPGGCGQHRFGLCQRPFSSDPSRVRLFDLYVAHDSDDDVCGEIQHTTLRFDVSGLADEFRARAEPFGFSPEPPLVLYVEGFRDPVPLSFD